MNWQTYLGADEPLVWEGRPAPRCFTFRNWRHSVFGIIFLLLCSWWQSVGIQMAAVYELPWLAWLPTPFLLGGLYLSLGHLLLARLEWDKVFYAASGRRLLVRRGLLRLRLATLDLERLSYFRMQPLGKELGTFRVHGAPDDPVLVLHCIEHPQRLIALLEQAMGERACPLPPPDVE